MVAGATQARSTALRGWVNAAETTITPLHTPPAGVNVELRQYAEGELEVQLDRIAKAGFVWVRQSFYWAEIEPSAGTFAYEQAGYDRIMRALASHPTLKVLAVLDSAPGWARRPEGSDRLFTPPASMVAFGAFAGSVAQRYGTQIDHYQIWDEPNLNTHWGGLDPRPAEYAAMLKAASVSIKAADANAVVITAGLAPTTETGPRNVSDVLFLKALYEAGVQESFDAVAGKPYGFNSSPLDRTVDPDVLNFSRIVLLRDVMVSHGDGAKPLWASHFGWNSLPSGWSGPPSIWGQVEAATQGDYTRQAYTRAAQEWPWLGGMILAYWDPPAAADDPIQGFAVKDRAAAWFNYGAFFKHEPLTAGLYTPTDARIQFNGDWEFGPLGADVQYKQGDPPPPEDGSAHRFTFTFEGDSLGLKVRRSPEVWQVAFLYVRVDGEPANALPRSDKTGSAYLILRAPNDQPSLDTLLVAKGLGAGTHTAEVSVYLGYDQWVLVGIAVGNTPEVATLNGLIGVGGLLAVFGVLLGIVAIWRMPRQAQITAQRGVAAYVRKMVDIIASVLLSVLTMLGLLLTFGEVLPNVLRRDPPALVIVAVTAGLAYFSNIFLLTVALLVVLWVIIYNRPTLGLALILFWTPLFLAPLRLYNAAFPMAEICLLLTITAVLFRSLIEWLRGRVTESAVGETVTAPSRRWEAVDVVMLAFGLVAVVTLLWADQRAEALRTLRQIVIEPVLFFFLLRRLTLTPRDWSRLIDALFLGVLVVCGLGLAQYFNVIQGVVIAEQGARRLTSIYGSPNNVALLLGRCIPFALALALLAPNLLRRIASGAILLVFGVTLLLTQSAGAILLGVPASILVMLLLWNRRIGLIAIGVLVVALLALIPLSRFVPRLQGILDLSRSSSFIRTQIWTSSYYLLRDRPLTGAGLDQFLHLYRSRYILPDAWREPNLSHPHNVVLDYWISLGIGGVGLLLAQQLLFWRAAARAWTRWRAVDPLLAAAALGAIGSMVSFLAHGLVDNSYFVFDLAYLFCFAMALVTRLAKAQLPVMVDAAEKP